MAYTTISELPELLDINGNEYLLVTYNEESKKLKTSTMINTISTDAIQNAANAVNITVYDEGTQVGSVKKINFIGNTVNSFLNNDTIDIYVPSVILDSIFNTNITTDARVKEVLFDNRYISESPFYIGEWIPGTLQKVTNLDVIEYTTYEKFRLENNSQFEITVEHYVNDLLSETSTINVNDLILGINNISNPLFDLVFNKEKENSFLKGSFNLKLNTSLFNGRVKLMIKYIGYETTEFIDEFFVDNSVELPELTLITNLDILSYKFLSGLKFINDANINNNINLINSKNLTYPNDILDIDNTLAGGTLKTILAENIINSFSYNTDVSYIDTYKLLSNKFYYNITIKARVNDWLKGNYVEYNTNALIDTYTDSSTRIYESFISETNRLDNNFNIFNSELILGDYDLQVFNSKLIYPQTDYTLYENPDYSNYINDRNYIRKFWHSNISHTNGIFQIVSNISETDLINENIIIEISLDSINWYNCAKDYEGGLLINNSGCRINSDINNLNVNNKIEFTLGLDKYTDETSNWGIYFKITIKETVKYKFIDSLQIINWN